MLEKLINIPFGLTAFWINTSFLEAYLSGDIWTVLFWKPEQDLPGVIVTIDAVTGTWQGASFK